MENQRIIQVEDKVPFNLLVPLSIQHMFAMFGASILVPFIFGINPAVVLFMNSVGTLLFIGVTKGKAPAYLGSSFAFLAPAGVVISNFGYEYALGGFVAVGFCGCILAFIVYKFGTEWIEVVLPPAAMGPVVALIGLELSGSAASNAGLLDEVLDPGLPYVECDSDERLGPDRAAADIAAIAKYGAPLVVLDFGTATTLDAVSREGVYLGGCITAGVQVSIDGLFQKTALLPRVELVKPDTVLSTTAVGQIQAGAVLGYIGAIEYLIRHAKEEIGQPDTKVVATGGLSRLVADNTELIDVVDPQLVLDGLRIIYERARR